jgi:glycosyltransferase involved in cell wall biosynthesis
LNILELCFSDGCGGLEHYAHRSINWLRNHGHSVQVLVGRETPLAHWLEDDNTPYQCMPRPSRTFPIYTALRVARTIERHDVDVIHIHSSRDLILAVLAKLFSQHSTGLVYSVHLRPRDSKRDPVHRRVYGGVDLLVANSKCVLEDVKLNLPVSGMRCEFLYPGVGDIRPVDCQKRRRQLGLPGAKFTVALFGRIEHDKGQHVLVQAAKHLLEQGVDVCVFIAGPVMDGEYLDALQRDIAASGLRDCGLTAEYISNTMDSMQCVDAVVLPTYNEAFGLVLIEAMNAGAVVIGANVGGVPEIIHDGYNGLLFQPGDSQGLARHIKALAQNTQLQERLIANGKQTVRKKFLEKEHYRQLVQLFDTLPSRPTSLHPAGS